MVRTLMYSDQNVISAIGNTPLLKVDGIYAKLESVNPSGSIKDRVALEIITAAEQEGLLKPGYRIVEASSGNTGISLAMIAACKGYHMMIVMPENMSRERKLMMKAFGAELVLTSKSGSLQEAIEKAEELAQEPHTFYTRQFANPNNIMAHIKTGKEIAEKIGPVDAVVAGVGTGGTLIGISSVMKELNPDVKVIAVEPEEAAVMFGGSNVRIGEHRIQGIGDGFIPKLIDMEKVDRVIVVGSQEAVDASRRLAQEFGILAGISSGANFLAASKVAKAFDKVVTVFPDRGERYLSMDLFQL
jgi:cysteine synthase